MKSCEYCDPDLIPGQNVVLENDYAMFMQLTIQEIEGSGIIVPKQHRETVFDLTPEEWNATYELLHQAKQHIDQRHKPDGYNVGWNCGEIGGQHVFHAHMHVIPRYADEPMAGRGLRYLFKSRENRRPSLQQPDSEGKPGYYIIH
ncbi:HIT family protein [Paenibacillus lemnae]|uniref:HIT domain-containing protein n=1 Tax=Paenibacillus lemnae TaxID=1330551 RepID=A0A848M9V6_PAELE|nr:HIT domain-containing protein [Paenibacillus lemnae]NMO97039.1 HIT domain-containing protein [Paenibacillus lemnae]